MHKLLTDLAHICLGLLAATLGALHIFTAIYIVYQLVDFYCERNCEEIKRDIAEYAAGAVIGLIVKLLLNGLHV